MTLRLKDRARYFLAYDAESRLTSVSGTVSASFVYNGDGQRVSATIDTTITTYIGGYFEWQGGVGKSYYFAGGQRIAMRTSTGVEFLLGDHLGSTSLTVDSLGSNPRELRYYPWGGVRWASGTTPTDYRFTGQQEIASIGLYFYNARWYDSALGRFVQADTIISSGLQGWDRYAGFRNNPLKYIDPSGHLPCMDGYCGNDYNGADIDPLQYWKDMVLAGFGVTLSDDILAWTARSSSAIYFALFNADARLGGVLKSWIHGTTFYHENRDYGSYGGKARADSITFGFNASQTAPFQNIYHELGHMLNMKFGNFFSETLDSSSIYDSNGEFVMGRNAQGKYDRQLKDGYSMQHVGDPYWGAGGIDAEQHQGTIDLTDDWGIDGNSAGEEWGDLFANYISGNISYDKPGVARMEWINTVLYDFIYIPGSY
jgi:RHS repeat-associated protein